YEQYCEPVTQKCTTYQIQCKEVPCTYTVPEMVPTTQKQTRITYKYVQEEVPYYYTEWTPVVTTQKVPQTTYTTVQEPQEYSWTECVPNTTYQKQTYTVYRCVPRTIQESVPCNYLVRVPVNDCGDYANDCGGCGPCGGHRVSYRGFCGG